MKIWRFVVFLNDIDQAWGAAPPNANQNTQHDGLVLERSVKVSKYKEFDKDSLSL